MFRKQEAIKLRKKGFSYNEIKKKIKVPKGTLSYWFKDLAFSKKITKSNIKSAKGIWAKNIIAFNKKRALLIKQKNATETNEAEKEFKFKINKENLTFLGTALYWAEGYKKGKWNVIFSNSDLEMNVIMLKFFKDICLVPEEKIKFQIQHYRKESEKEILNFWASNLKVKKTQFLKSFIAKGSKDVKKHKLMQGTLRIRINDVRLVNKIRGYIEAMKKTIINGA